MKRCRAAIIALFLLTVLAGAPSARAFNPHGWIYSDQPLVDAYAYSYDQFHWWYISSAAVMRCYDFVDQDWVLFPYAFSGWLFFDWPYAYSMNSARWYYFNPADVVYCLNFVTGAWTEFGWQPYSQADATGAWTYNDVAKAGQSNGRSISRVVMDVRADGLFTGVYCANRLPYQDVTGSLTLDGQGRVELQFGGSPSPASMEMDASRNYAIGVVWDGVLGYSRIRMLARRGDTYGDAQLPGTWYYGEFINGSAVGDVDLRVGPCTIDNSLALTAYLYGDAGTPDVVTGSAAIDAVGNATFTTSGTEMAAMDLSAAGDVMIGAQIIEGDATPDRDLRYCIALKRAPSYALGDAVGVWRFARLTMTGQQRQVDRGTICIYPDGRFTWKELRSNGGTLISEWTIDMTPQGMVTFFTPGVQVQLSAGHNVMAGMWGGAGNVTLFMAVRTEE